MLKLLSPSEYIVLCLIADGNTNIEISEKLFTSVREIEDIVKSIFKKLKVRNCFQAAIKLAINNQKKK